MLSGEALDQATWRIVDNSSLEVFKAVLKEALG